MKLIDCLLVSLRALRTNRLRSFLTTLGIVVGVAALIVMVGVGSGARSRVESVIQSLGPAVSYILPAAANVGGVRSTGAASRLSERDVAAIRAEVVNAHVVAPWVQGPVRLVFGNLNWTSRAHGVTNELFSARDWTLSEGRFFEEPELRSGKAAILGATVARELFGGNDPLGQIVRINRVPFEIVGVLQARGQTVFGTDQDDAVFVPLNTARQRLFGRFQSRPDMVDSIAVKAVSTDALASMEESLKALMRRRQLPIGAGDAYQVRNSAQMLEAQASSSRAMAYLLAAVACVSLIVGGIGIMNVMLVSVMERTREIGLLMAFGARRRDILAQFLVESVTLSLVGGAIGVSLGLLGSALVAQIADWPVVIEPAAVALAFGFAAAVGILFGFYPARKASRLDPIEALRYE
jgi:putative ABC transport system permease protein